MIAVKTSESLPICVPEAGLLKAALNAVEADGQLLDDPESLIYSTSPENRSYTNRCQDARTFCEQLEA